MNARLPILFAALALPLAAAAQTSDISVTAVSVAQQNLSLTDCKTATVDDTIGFSWLVPITVGGTMQESVFLSKSESCTLEANQSPLVDHSRTQVGGTSVNWPIEGKDPLRVSDIFNFLSNSGTCASLGEVEQNVYVCVKVVADNLGTSSTHTGKLTIKVDTKPPPVPTAVTATPLDGGLKVSWTMDNGVGDAKGFKVYLDGTLAQTTSGSDLRSSEINGLLNGTEYGITVTAIDGAGTTVDRFNESAKSAVAKGIPLDSQDFWERYSELGGKETGGCAGAGASPLALLAVAGLFVARRRRLGLALALLALPATSFADGLQRLHESPRAYTFTMQIGGFLPGIDGEAGLTGTPYKDIFGTDSPLLWRAGLDYDLFKKFGRLSLGVSGGFWQAVGKGIYTKDNTVSADTVLLDLWPITPSLAYRFDPGVAIGIPLVPFVRVGYGFAKWRTEASSTTSSVNGNKGEGWAQGLELSAGVQLVLDVFEPGKAAELDEDFGINSTGLYFDATQAYWKGAGGLALDGATYSGGLMLAF